MGIEYVLPQHVQALAYPRSNPESICECTLVLKRRICGDKSEQATISVQLSIHVLGVSEKQPFTLLYHPDNLIPGTTKLDFPVVRIPHDKVQRLGRDKQAPATQTLFLTLKNQCPVLCPRHLQSIAPAEGHENSFRNLLKLAEATEIHILFDRRWLHARYDAWFKKFIQYPERLAGLEDYQSPEYRNRLKNWEFFTCVKVAECEDLAPYHGTKAAVDPVPESPTSENVPPPYTFASKHSMIETLSCKPQSSSQLSQPDLQERVNVALQTSLHEGSHLLLDLFSPSTPPRNTSHHLAGLEPLAKLLLDTTFKPLVEATLQQVIKVELPSLHQYIVDELHPLISEAQDDLHDIRCEYRAESDKKKDDDLLDLERVMCDNVSNFKESLTAALEELKEHASGVLAEILPKDLGALEGPKIVDTDLKDAKKKHKELEKRLKQLEKKHDKSEKERKRIKKKQKRMKKKHEKRAKELKEILSELEKTSTSSDRATTTSSGFEAC